ncbi:MAG: phytanoyl-CoA dioxygenase [Alphaproteobacteria bacterium]|nr:phytanoyl-CoA dioxygenase [Alphaproteobacteria bacterium]
MNGISTDAVADYRRDGFYAPLTALSPEKAAAYRVKLEDLEERLGGRITSDAVDGKYRYRLHTLFTWAHELVTIPTVLDTVEALIGPDILVYTTTFFIKEPHTEAITGWHQDATYFGLRPYEHVSAWIALSPATLESGCMRFVPGSHAQGQRDHRAHSDTKILNTGGQQLTAGFDRQTAVPAPLEPGQFSLHHTLTIHHSPANNSDERRIGFAVSYIPAQCRHLGQERRAPAMLVRGVDNYGHFELDTPPHADFDASAQEHHTDSYGRYRANYNDQVARVSEFGEEQPVE